MFMNFRRSAVTFATLLLVGGTWGAADASAQLLGVTADARIGAAIPLGDLGDVQDPGLSLGAGIGIPVFMNRIFLRGDVDANFLSGLEMMSGGVTLETEGLDAYTVAGGVSVDLLGPASPWSAFVYGGVGPTFLSFPNDESETRFSASGAVKAGRSVGPAFVGLRAKVHRIGLDEEEFGTDGWTLGQIQALVQIGF